MKPPLLLRPGLVSVTFRQLGAREIVDRVVSCGLRGIEWGGDVHVTDSSVAAEVRKMTEGAGLSVAAFGSYWRANGEFGPVLETAVALGAPTVRVWAGRLASAEETDRPAVVAALKDACERAGQVGVAVSLEYHGGTLTDTLDSTLRLVDEIRDPALRLYWQPVPERAHEVRFEELRAVLPWLSNVHVFQWTRPQQETFRHPLSEGKGEWPAVLALAEGERYALLEFVPGDDPAVLETEAATLISWLSSQVQVA